MRRWTRALLTLLASAAAGSYLVRAPLQRAHDRRLLGRDRRDLPGRAAARPLAAPRSRRKPEGKLLVAFVPVLVAAGWVILAAQPNGGWVRNHVLSWSGQMGIGHAVHNLGEHVVVLAFALGIVFGVTFEPAMARRGRRRASAAPLVVLTGAGARPLRPATVRSSPRLSSRRRPRRCGSSGQPPPGTMDGRSRRSSSRPQGRSTRRRPSPSSWPARTRRRKRATMSSRQEHEEPLDEPLPGAEASAACSDAPPSRAREHPEQHRARTSRPRTRPPARRRTSSFSVAIGLPAAMRALRGFVAVAAARKSAASLKLLPGHVLDGDFVAAAAGASSPR